MRGYVERLLVAEGFSVEAVADGEAALSRARQDAPDLILTDVMMPKLDGFGLLSQVRADDHLRHIPLIMLSARAGEEARVEGLAAGADDYLIKPFTARELIARVGTNMALARARRDSAVAVAQSEARLRTVFATSFQYQALLDLDGRVVEANDALLSGVGTGAGDIVGKPLWETSWFSATPDVANAIADAFASVVTGEAMHREVHLNLPVGGLAVFRFRHAPGARPGRRGDRHPGRGRGTDRAQAGRRGAATVAKDGSGRATYRRNCP